jgi:hypothetical protein
MALWRSGALALWQGQKVHHDTLPRLRFIRVHFFSPSRNFTQKKKFERKRSLKEN